MRTLALDTIKKIGKKVVLQGWVNSRRDHGKIMFLDLRDRSGIVQVVCAKSLGELHAEDVVQITGLVKKRPPAMINPKLTTGNVEVEAQSIRIYSRAQTLPFPIDTSGDEINEEVRLAYRYLDLRREKLNRHIKLRSRLVDLARQYLFKDDFTEIETPLLTKSTPEGSRDFLVPSRMQPGKFYALPQSPQQYKQLLMVAGFERYFQIARCLRDEDLRADRGFEHTQVDIEMSFVNREDVMALVEGLAIEVVEKLGGKILQKPFPVYTFSEALKQFGADKFDLRCDREKEQGLNAFAWVVDFPFFEKDKEGNWTFTHNPFSDPVEEDKQAFLAGKIEGVKTTQYDLVWNGYEAGGGSIRSTDPVILSRVFEVLGYTKGQIEKQFGHMLKAFSFGVPPHGGIALGIERWMMCLTGAKSIKEVQAFPMTSGGQTSVMQAPSQVEELQLRELGIAVADERRKGDVYQRIIEFLDNQKIKYQAYEHEAVFTSSQAAKVRHTPPHAGAKALVMMADQKPIMIVLPGDLKVDTKAIKQLYGIKDLRMATPPEVESLTQTKIGAVPPLGNLFNLPLYLDEKLRDNKEIIFNAGLHTRSIQMRESDFEKVAQAVIGKFSQSL